MSETAQMLTVDEVADLLRVTRVTVYRMIRRGDLPVPVKVGPRSVRFRKRDITAVINGLSPDSVADEEQDHEVAVDEQEPPVAETPAPPEVEEEDAAEAAEPTARPMEFEPEFEMPPIVEPRIELTEDP
jgi:excisionase family DNA binding protein